MTFIEKTNGITAETFKGENKGRYRNIECNFYRDIEMYREI